MENLADSASLHSGYKNAPSNPGIKHLSFPASATLDMIDWYSFPLFIKMHLNAVPIPLNTIVY
jgi:hypothetical protein